MNRDGLSPTANVVSAEARIRVDRIKTGVEVVWSLIVESYNARDWDALGYSSWDDMCTREFGTARLRLPREERAETVQSLRASGLSLRAIESATGHSQHTIIRDLRQAQVLQSAAPAVASESTGETVDDVLTEEQCEQIAAERTGQPATVTGLDGKSYQRLTSPPKPRQKPGSPVGLPGTDRDVRRRRRPLPDAFWDATHDIQKPTATLVRLLEDDRWRANVDTVRERNRGVLGRVIADLQRVYDAMGTVEQEPLP